ncbi:hypothetical protein [Kitasatospora sp. NPDC096140]|uniref:hypothetical protein n=1 Tax=Kitasatospora sp. NPDC096140 TaxID=3155425 RepID=UPI00332A561D
MDADEALWYRIADLLPEPAREEVKDCWLIGEQECGLDLLVGGLLARQVPIGGADRAQIAVLAEQWGGREQLTPGILRCPDDGAPAPVRLLDAEGFGGAAGDGQGAGGGGNDGGGDGTAGDGTAGDGADGGDGVEVVTGWREPELADLLLVPWIECTRCGRVLLRAHSWEPWDDLSYLAEYYVISTSDYDTALRILPYGAVGEAFAELLHGCPEY